MDDLHALNEDTDAEEVGAAVEELVNVARDASIAFRALALWLELGHSRASSKEIAQLVKDSGAIADRLDAARKVVIDLAEYHE